jgi:hypothetical protein
MTSAPSQETQTPTANDVIADAERCRREAKAMVEKHPERYGELIGQPSGWCVVTEKRPWSRTFHSMLNEDSLRERIERGHKVALTVGLVAAPGAGALTSTNHTAVVLIAEPRKHSADKLAMIATRAKVYCAASLYR